MNAFPLPFHCRHHRYTPGVPDAHGNPTGSWLPPSTVACVWWTPSSTEPAGAPTGTDIVAVDAVLILDVAVTVDHRDRFDIDGVDFGVTGLPKDYNHGPFGISPDRIVIELRAVN